MHWCSDESLAVLSAIPVVGYYFRKLHIWYHNKSHHPCHEKQCNKTHAEHCFMPANIPHGKVGEGQCDQHPLEQEHTITKEDAEYLRATPEPLKILVPVEIEESTIWELHGFDNEKDWEE